MFILKGLLKNILGLCLLGFLWQSCNIINPAEVVPTYVHVDSFTFINNPKYNNISFSHKITSIWVYYNNNPIGVFDLPATIPIMASGFGSLEITPGINVNGQNSQINAYPFYTIDTFSFNAQPGKVIQHVPKTGYYDGLKFTTLLNQYNLGFSEWGGTTGISFVKSDTLEFQPPNWSAGIFLNTAADSSIDSSNISFPIPTGAAFIEFNYKCTVPFYLGLQAIIAGTAQSTPYYLTGIYANDTWQKFYLSVGEFNAQYQGTAYRLYIKASVPDGQSNGKVLLDNIQLVTF